MSASPAPDYAGDLSVQQAWDLLAQDPKVQLIDVRTVAEWNFLGLADLSSLERPVHRIEWQSYPSMQPNPHFVADKVPLRHSAHIDQLHFGILGQEVPGLLDAEIAGVIGSGGSRHGDDLEKVRALPGYRPA